MIAQLRRFHERVVGKYRREPHSVRSRLYVLLIIVYCTLPAALGLLLPLVLVSGRYSNLPIVALIVGMLLGLLLLISRGRQKLASLIFSFGITVIFLTGHFTGDWSTLVATDALLLDRLGYAGVVSIVACALVTDRIWIVALTACIFYGLGMAQTFLVQLPLLPKTLHADLLASTLRFGFTFPLLTTMISLLQAITRRSIRLVEEANSTLEQQVEERTRYLKDALERLQVAQTSLVDGEKLAVLGRLSASVAHEVNTPLAAISASVGTIRSGLASAIRQFPVVLTSLDAPSRALFADFLEKTAQRPTLLPKDLRRLRSTWRARLELLALTNAESLAESLAELGLLDFDPVWEPLIHLPGAAALFELVVETSHIHRAAAIIEEATDRGSEFVRALRRFVFREESPVERSTVDVVASLETVVSLLRSELRTNVTLVRDYEGRPSVASYPDLLLQVWSNLIQNALQAMHGSGELTLRIREEAGAVAVEVGDTGEGIPDHLREKIFEHFFTTKKFGEGTGLGLGIVREIVSKIGGSLAFESAPGKTVFRVVLPLT